MTGRERALAALRFEPTDRPPVAGALLQNAEFLAEYAGLADFWAAPRRTLFEAFGRLACHVILGPVMPKRPHAAPPASACFCLSRLTPAQKQVADTTHASLPTRHPRHLRTAPHTRISPRFSCL